MFLLLRTNIAKAISRLNKLQIILLYIKKISRFAPQNLKQLLMKKDIHPKDYRLVAFKDMSNNDIFITKDFVFDK